MYPMPRESKSKPNELISGDDESYPQLICEGCGYWNQLDFDPRDDGGLLTSHRCLRCQNFSHWSHYYDLWDLVAMVRITYQSTSL